MCFDKDDGVELDRFFALETAFIPPSWIEYDVLQINKSKSSHPTSHRPTLYFPSPGLTAKQQIDLTLDRRRCRIESVFRIRNCFLSSLLNRIRFDVLQISKIKFPYTFLVPSLTTKQQEVDYGTAAGVLWPHDVHGWRLLSIQVQLDIGWTHDQIKAHASYDRTSHGIVVDVTSQISQPSHLILLVNRGLIF